MSYTRQTHKKLKGQNNYSHDPRFRVQEFNTTLRVLALLWVIAFWIPVIPLVSFRVRREFQR